MAVASHPANAPRINPYVTGDGVFHVVPGMSNLRGRMRPSVAGKMKKDGMILVNGRPYDTKYNMSAEYAEFRKYRPTKNFPASGAHRLALSFRLR
jgi:hypothetical protein